MHKISNMTDEELREKYKDVPTSQLLKRLLQLCGLLIIEVAKYLFVNFLKGIIWCWERIIDAGHELNDYWHSNDTQEKKKKTIEALNHMGRKAAEWCGIAWFFTKKYTIIGAKEGWKYTKIGCKLFVKYLLISLVAIWHGIIWTIYTIKDLIIHSKPTFIRLGKSIKQGSIDFWHWTVRVCRGIKLRHIRRKRAWQHFRRTKGFKGLLIDCGHAVSNGIKSYMDEEQAESHPEAITEDDIIAEELEGRQSKGKMIGEKIFKGMKNIVEEKEN